MEGVQTAILDLIRCAVNDVAFLVLKTVDHFNTYNVPFSSLNLNVRVHKKDPFFVIALPGAKLFESVLEFVDAACKGMVESKEKREAFETLVKAMENCTLENFPMKARSSGNLDRIDKIVMPLVNGHCVVNSAYDEDLSDFRSRGRCLKIKNTKEVGWEGLALGEYSIFLVHGFSNARSINYMKGTTRPNLVYDNNSVSIHLYITCFVCSC